MDWMTRRIQRLISITLLIVFVPLVWFAFAFVATIAYKLAMLAVCS